MKSRIFYSEAYLKVQEQTLALLNQQQAFLSPHTLHSPRATGDAVQDILTTSFATILGDWAAEYSASFARRAMADLAFRDIDDNYYIVDVKTHRSDTKFNMPNLTSVERLARFYEDDKNYFVMLMARYALDEMRAQFSEVIFVPIEFLDWRCLTIGALGWGQIQIANSNRILVNPQYSRRQWMLELCDILLEFYPREIAKITERSHYFEAVKAYWLTKAEA
jgi:hypothetical protein